MRWPSSSVTRKRVLGNASSTTPGTGCRFFCSIKGNALGYQTRTLGSIPGECLPSRPVERTPKPKKSSALGGGRGRHHQNGNICWVVRKTALPERPHAHLNLLDGGIPRPNRGKRGKRLSGEILPKRVSVDDRDEVR